MSMPIAFLCSVAERTQGAWVCQHACPGTFLDRMGDILDEAAESD